MDKRWISGGKAVEKRWKSGGKAVEKLWKSGGSVHPPSCVLVGLMPLLYHLYESTRDYKATRSSALSLAINILD